jgi:hypothetical protein
MTRSSRSLASRETPSPLPDAPNVEVVLRHFHRCRSPRAARCSSFVGGGFGLLVASYEEIRWTRGFTWFGPPDRNTLRPRVNGVVLLCLSIRLKSRGPFLCVCPWRLPGPFIVQGGAVTVRPHGPTGGPEAGRHLRSKGVNV